MPLVSIIVPIYNAGLNLEPCLASLAAQTHAPLEVLLVDDGSNDGSEEVCAAWAGRDERFHFLHFGLREGPNPARGFGLAAAKGEWIGFVDADDLVHPRFVEFMLAAGGETGAEAVCCRYKPFMGARPAMPDIDISLGPPPAKLLAAPAHTEALLHDQRVDYSLCNKLYRRGVLDGSLFETQVRYNEDLLTNWQAFARLGGLGFLDWAGYYYRQNPASATRRGLSPAFFADQAAVARQIRDEAAGPRAAEGLGESGWAFYFEKLLYLHSMILRQDAPEYFERERTALEAELRPQLRRALSCKALRWPMKVVGLLACYGGGAYRALCRAVLRDRQM